MIFLTIKHFFQIKLFLLFILIQIYQILIINLQNLIPQFLNLIKINNQTNYKETTLICNSFLHTFI